MLFDSCSTVVRLIVVGFDTQSLSYAEKAHEMQGQLVQAHGKGVRQTVSAMRRAVCAQSAACEATLKVASAALQHIQKEAVSVAAVDASVTGEP